MSKPKPYLVDAEFQRQLKSLRKDKELDRQIKALRKIAREERKWRELGRSIAWEEARSKIIAAKPAAGRKKKQKQKCCTFVPRPRSEDVGMEKEETAQDEWVYCEDLTLEDLLEYCGAQFEEMAKEEVRKKKKENIQKYVALPPQLSPRREEKRLDRRDWVDGVLVGQALGSFFCLVLHFALY